MSGFDEDDGFVTETPVKTLEHKSGSTARMGRGGRALSMFDAQRSSLFGTMAGLLDGGLPMDVATELLSSEFRREGANDAAMSVDMFFGTVAAVRNAAGEGPYQESFSRIEDAAFEAFGNKFVGAEEMSLLKALAVASLPSRILESCSLLLSRYEASRAPSMANPARRYVG